MKEKNKGYKIIKGILSPIFKVLYRPTIINDINIPSSGPAILAGNHKKAVDPALVVISTKRMVRFLAKKELHQGWTRGFFKTMGTIPVDRSKKDVNATDFAIKSLQNGDLISIFPEGTRNKTKEVLLPFKFGAVSFAKKTNSPIIPFAITGEYKVFRKKIKIEFGKPIYVTNMELKEANIYLANEIKNLILKKEESI